MNICGGAVSCVGFSSSTDSWYVYTFCELCLQCIDNCIHFCTKQTEHIILRVCTCLLAWFIAMAIQISVVWLKN